MIDLGYYFKKSLPLIAGCKKDIRDITLTLSNDPTALFGNGFYFYIDINVDGTHIYCDFDYKLTKSEADKNFDDLKKLLMADHPFIDKPINEYLLRIFPCLFQCYDMIDEMTLEINFKNDSMDMTYSEFTTGYLTTNFHYILTDCDNYRAEEEVMAICDEFKDIKKRCR